MKMSSTNSSKWDSETVALYGTCGIKEELGDENPCDEIMNDISSMQKVEGHHDGTSFYVKKELCPDDVNIFYQNISDISLRQVEGHHQTSNCDGEIGTQAYDEILNVKKELCVNDVDLKPFDENKHNISLELSEELNKASNLDRAFGFESYLCHIKEEVSVEDIKPFIQDSSSSTRQNGGSKSSTVESSMSGSCDVVMENCIEEGKVSSGDAFPSLPSTSIQSDSKGSLYYCGTTSDSESKTQFALTPASLIDKIFDNDNRMKKEPLSLIESSTNLRPIVIDSNVDHIVAGREDLENDIAGRSILPTGDIPVYVSEKELDHTIFSDENIATDKNKYMEKRKRLESRNHMSVSPVKPLKQIKKTVRKELDDDWKCQLCDLAFTKSQLLAAHMTDFHTDQNIKTSTPTHLINETGEPHNYKMKRNLSEHTGEKTFTCDQCNKSFSRITSLRNHLKSHTAENQFKCGICDKSFSGIRNLQKHIKTHTSEKIYKYKCDHCNRFFMKNNHLDDHLRTHTSEKPFMCDQCYKSFSNSGSLHKHMRIHTGERPYKCDQCNKCFNQSGILRNHKRIHTGEKPFRCNHCDKTYSRKGDLQNHMRSHTGEKPFNCSECDKSFSRVSVFHRHMREHTGEKPFRCDQCDVSFRRSSDLCNHMKSHAA